MYNRLKNNLHGIFDKSDPELDKLLEALGTVWEDLITQRDEITLMRFLETAEGIYLDIIGAAYEDSRMQDEDDDDYRDRLREYLTGRGVTRPGIKSIIDRILYPQSCTIIKWDEPDAQNQLERGQFELQLPLREVSGFVLEQSYLEQDTFLNSFDAIKLLWDLVRIRRTLDKTKPIESKYILTTGGVVL